MSAPIYMWLLAVPLAGLIAYGVAIVLLFWLQGRLIYPPERVRRPSGAPQGDGRIGNVRLRTVDGVELMCGYAAPARADSAIVVLFHGNGEDIWQREHIAHDLLDAGYGVLLAEYRGYGGSAGRPHEAGLYADGRAALEFAAQRARRVVVHGYSLGTGVAVQIAIEYALTALILEAPFTSIADVAATWFRWLPVRRLVRDRYDSLSKIGAVRAPVLIYGGSADGVIPPAHFSRLHAALDATGRFVMLDDANHVDAWERGGRDHVLRFLHEHRSHRPRAPRT